MRANRSRYEIFSDCERKYYHMFMPHVGAPLGLVKSRSAMALRIGSAAHRFLEVWYDNLDIPTPERLQLAHNALNTSFRSSRADILMPTEEKSDDQVIQETEAMMDMYVKRYGPREEFTVLQPEVSGEVMLGKHVFVFQTDAVVLYEDHLWLLEHKTTWQLGPTFLEKFDLNHQMTSYTWATGKLLGKLISGIMLNALRKPSKQAKTPLPEFLRRTFVITEDHIKNMLSSFYYKFSDIESRDPNNIEDWPQDTNRCHDYGKCPYWEICALGSPAEVGSIYKAREADYVEDPTMRRIPTPQ